MAAACSGVSAVAACEVDVSRERRGRRLGLEVVGTARSGGAAVVSKWRRRRVMDVRPSSESGSSVSIFLTATISIN
jgi:hypothetical protein